MERSNRALTLQGVLTRWRELRTTGVAAGSQCQEMALLRAYLLAVGKWREVYAIPRR